jgi:hypothetical protein
MQLVTPDALREVFVINLHYSHSKDVVSNGESAFGTARSASLLRGLLEVCQAAIPRLKREKVVEDRDRCAFGLDPNFDRQNVRGKRSLVWWLVPCNLLGRGVSQSGNCGPDIGDQDEAVASATAAERPIWCGGDGRDLIALLACY